MMYLLVLGGLFLLFAGGESLVRGAVAIAKRIGISPLLVGLTVVGFGTSAPELVVSLEAGLKGQPDIALGNVVGSNIANILLILAISAVISPIRCHPSIIFRDGSVMIGCSILLVILGFTGQIQRWHGILMVLFLVIFIIYSYWSEKYKNAPSAELHLREAEEFEDIPLNTGWSVVTVIFGIIALVGGSKMLVMGASAIARSHGVPEAIIGLTLIAVGTSLPELATSIVAAYRKHTDVVVGNVVGSNIFNILLILGFTSIVIPLAINPAVASFDLWIMLIVAIGLVPFLMTGWRLSRIEGGLFLGAYVVYMVYLYTIM